MPMYAVSYQHPDEARWAEHLMSHIVWLQDRLKDGSLCASGPLTDLAVKSALLIMSTPDRAALERLIATDPFALHGLIEDMTINEWDPIFGTYNGRSSMPGQMQGS